VLPRLDRDPAIRAALLPRCRLHPGEIWTDPAGRHRVGCLDATSPQAVRELAGGATVTLAVQDPPYNVAAFESRRLDDYLTWSRAWLSATCGALSPDASLYLFTGADQAHEFQPLPDLMLLLRQFSELRSRSFITLRNQRGYGTQRNWMAVRQELLMYVKGEPPFTVQYTQIPRRLRGYYKEVGGRRTETSERSRSPTLRPGNVWVDVQQVFYRLEENVGGCYAQKPLRAIERIVAASSRPGELVLDTFAHAGTTLLACERLGRPCATADLDPVYCEITIRRLEHFRATGRTGWGRSHAFAGETEDSGLDR
jgi:site-specific DNA-methyltransferase (adenine-specific)